MFVFPPENTATGGASVCVSIVIWSKIFVCLGLITITKMMMIPMMMLRRDAVVVKSYSSEAVLACAKPNIHTKLTFMYG